MKKDQQQAVRIPIAARRSDGGSGVGTATSVGDQNLDAAVDAVNVGLLMIRGMGGAGLTGEGAVQLLTEIVVAARRLDAAYLHAVALVEHLDAAGSAGLGARSTQGLLKTLGGLAPGRAKADVAAARAIHGDSGSGTAATHAGPLRELGTKLARGEVSKAHVDTAVRTLGKLPTELLEASMVPEENAEAGADDAEPDDAEPDDTEPAAEPAAAGSDGTQFEPQTVRESIAEYFAKMSPTTSPANMNHLAKHLIEVLDPDADDHFDPDSFNRRSVTMSTDITGMVFGTYQLDPSAGARLRAILDPLSAPRPMQYDDDGNVAVRDDRSPTQRRADGLMELVEAASGLAAVPTRPGGSGDGGSGPGGSGDGRADAARQGCAEDSGAAPDAAAIDDAVTALFGLVGDADGSVSPGKASKLRPGRRPAQVTVVTTPEKLAGTDPAPSHCLQTGQIGRGTLQRIACDATFERLIMDARSAVLDLGVGVRLATPAQKRAVAARDMGCVFPGCDRPPSWCDVHHVIWYSRGGPTNVDNICLLCPQHHTLIHTGQWELTMIQGVPYARPGPEVVKVKVRGMIARSYGTRSFEGRWVRNSYFDDLKDAEHFARSIVASAPDPLNPLGRACLRPR